MFILFWEKIRVIHFNFIISPVVQGFLWILLSHSSLLPNKRYIVLRELGGRLIQLNPTSFLTVGKPRGLGGIKFEIPGQDSVTRCLLFVKVDTAVGGKTQIYVNILKTQLHNNTVVLPSNLKKFGSFFLP